MRRIIAALGAVAGTCTMASAVVNTQVTWQVSVDGTHWNSGLYLFGVVGQQVMARALVTYTGTGTPLGLASLVFQPTVSNALSTDSFSAFINGGVGGNTSTPLGVISGGQLSDTTTFGRVSPWGRSATASSSAIRGFFHTNPEGSGLNYLRVAQSQVTSWFGGAGNTTGGSGVNIAQLSNVGRTTSDPAFNGSLTDVYVFKFGFTLGNGSRPFEDMVIDSPPAGFGNRNTTTGEREVYWWGDMNEASGSIRGTAVVTPARLFVPAPASVGLLGLGAAVVGRRGR